MSITTCCSCCKDLSDGKETQQDNIDADTYWLCTECTGYKKDISFADIKTADWVLRKVDSSENLYAMYIEREKHYEKSIKIMFFIYTSVIWAEFLCIIRGIL